jgi:hypothetical protein
VGVIAADDGGGWVFPLDSVDWPVKITQNDKLFFFE